MNNYLVIRKSLRGFTSANELSSIGVIEAESEEGALKKARVQLRIPPDLMGPDGLMVIPFGEIRKL